jgi:hypothetical protein
MRIVKKKTQKKITKAFQKLVKKHGPEIGATLAGGIASSLAALASTRAPGDKGLKASLAKLSDDLNELLGGDGKKSRKKARSRKKGSATKGKHGSADETRRAKRATRDDSTQTSLEEEG